MTTSRDRSALTLAGGADFGTVVSRLSRLSLEKRFDAYSDVDWDAPDMQVHPGDSRWAPLSCDPVAQTDWYRSLPPEDRARYGLYRIAASMRTGWQFENFLQRGLLLRAVRLPNGSPEFRYLHHEIIEESQHTLMFQELVNRSGLPVRGMPLPARLAAAVVVGVTARWAPAGFFFLVLGGEEPVDYVQRQTLRDGHPHPLVERIMRIHVTEEARHVSFARHSLRRTVPRLNPVRRRFLAMSVPVTMAIMTRLMLSPPADLRRHCGLSRRQSRRAMRSFEGRHLLAGSVRRVRELCDELGLRTPTARRVWRAVGLAGLPAKPCPRDS